MTPLFRFAKLLNHLGKFIHLARRRKMYGSFWFNLAKKAAQLLYCLAVAAASCSLAWAISRVWPLVEARTGSVFWGVFSSLLIFFFLRFLLSFASSMRKTHFSLWMGLWGGPAMVFWEMHYVIPNWRWWTWRGSFDTAVISVSFLATFVAVNFLAKRLGWWTRRLMHRRSQFR